MPFHNGIHQLCARRRSLPLGLRWREWHHCGKRTERVLCNTSRDHSVRGQTTLEGRTAT